MKRYAFIDVQNTESTAQRMLGFSIDHIKLVDYLKNNRSCTEVFLYSGIDEGDSELLKEFDILAKTSCCSLKTKIIFSYKNKDKLITLECPKCENKLIHKIEMGYSKKSNCDVELSVDMFEKSLPDTELYIFTGDGDFEYLIRKALEKGVSKVYIYSYAERKTHFGITSSRFSTKLRTLISEDPDRVVYVSLKDIREKIKKDISNSLIGQ